MSDYEIEVLLKLRDEMSKGIKAIDKNIDNLERNSSKSFKKVGKEAAIAGAAIAAIAIKIGKDAVDAASDLNESLNATNKVFKDSAIVIQEFGEGSAQSVGLSNRAFNEMATRTGSLLKGFNFTVDQAATHTITLSKRAADMASVFNTDVETALAAINSALKGEADPIEQFGVSMNVATLEAYAMAQGLETSWKEMTLNQQASLRMQYILEQTSDTMGDFADTAEEYANSQKILNAEFENTLATLGQNLIPLANEATKALNKTLDSVNNVVEGDRGILEQSLDDGLLGWLLRVGDENRKFVDELHTYSTQVNSATKSNDKWAETLRIINEKTTELVRISTDLDPTVETLSDQTINLMNNMRMFVTHGGDPAIGTLGEIGQAADDAAVRITNLALKFDLYQESLQGRSRAQYSALEGDIGNLSASSLIGRGPAEPDTPTGGIGGGGGGSSAPRRLIASLATQKEYFDAVIRTTAAEANLEQVKERHAENMRQLRSEEADIDNRIADIGRRRVEIERQIGDQIRNNAAVREAELSRRHMSVLDKQEQENRLALAEQLKRGDIDRKEFETKINDMRELQFADRQITDARIALGRIETQIIEDNNKHKLDALDEELAREQKLKDDVSKRIENEQEAADKAINQAKLLLDEQQAMLEVALVKIAIEEEAAQRGFAAGRKRFDQAVELYNLERRIQAVRNDEEYTGDASLRSRVETGGSNGAPIVINIAGDVFDNEETWDRVFQGLRDRGLANNF